MYLYAASTNGFYLPEIHGTNIPADAQPISDELHTSLLAARGQGMRIIPDSTGAPVLVMDDAPPASVRLKLLEGVVQGHLDAAAIAQGFDDMDSAVSYAEEPAVPRYQMAGRALRAWRSLVWARCEQIMGEVMGGTRPEPTGPALIALLPAPPVFP